MSRGCNEVAEGKEIQGVVRARGEWYGTVREAGRLVQTGMGEESCSEVIKGRKGFKEVVKGRRE